MDIYLGFHWFVLKAFSKLQMDKAIQDQDGLQHLWLSLSEEFGFGLDLSGVMVNQFRSWHRAIKFFC